MIELGDKIRLDGFDDLDPALIIVIKKIIGSFANTIVEEKGEFSSFLINRENNRVSCELSVDEGSIKNEAEAPNLFFSLSQSLNGLISQNKTKGL